MHKKGNAIPRQILFTENFKPNPLIDRFNSADNIKFRVMLVSAKAGGEGIDLKGASRCVLIDCSWNPTTDLQSVFCIYRLGQSKPCFVYRMLAAGTMEERIYSSSISKQRTAARVLDDKEFDVDEGLETEPAGEFIVYEPGPKVDLSEKNFGDGILNSVLNDKSIEVLR